MSKNRYTATTQKAAAEALAAPVKNVCKGVLYEPRLYFDSFTFPANGTAPFQQGNPNVFRNGEQFPIWITHILAIMQGLKDQSPGQTPGPGDERLIQNYGMRIKGHDAYYMNGDVVPLPCWHNVRTAGSDPITRGNASWIFHHPVVLGQRDVFVVDVQLPLNANIETATTVAVTFSGHGMLSQRPYLLAAQASIAAGSTASVQLATDLFRNDGTEPIVIESMSIQANAPDLSLNPAGDIQSLSIQLRHNGNGTNQNWSFGPIPAGGGTAPLAPAALWGPNTGRAIVHKLPALGWLWQPGQGVDPEMIANATANARTEDETVWLGFSGYTVVT